MTRDDWQTRYWREIISESFDEHGITAEADQINKVAADVQGCHENWDLVSPTPSGPSQIEKDLAEAKRKLAEERDKVTCCECNGRGETTSYGPVHCSTSRCWKCQGKGRHAP